MTPQNGTRDETWRVWVRRTVNYANLSTPLGLALARAGHARIEQGPHGVLVAHGYDVRFPARGAPAFTVGDVVLVRLDAQTLAQRPHLLEHETRHCTQYACWLGPWGFLPAYLLASAWSWLRLRDVALGNRFERAAGLTDGGYLRPGEDVAAGAARRRQHRSVIPRSRRRS